MDPTQQNEKRDDPANVSANPGYALWQLASAFKTSQEHPDSEVRTRATTKIGTWIQVLEGMLSGALKIGSRTPLAKIPAWATIEVIRGGIATGNCLAEGPLQPHETELLARLNVPSSPDPRASLNQYYLSESGIAELHGLVTSGCYRVNIPEEGALLVIAWLLSRDETEAARDLLEVIGPYLTRFRFYPVPHAQPLPDGSLVYLQSVAETVRNLKAMDVSERFAAQREATLIWAPLCDRIVDLFIETLEGDIPSLQTGPDGKPFRTGTGAFIISGGWPCQNFPEGWQERARHLLEDYRRLRENHRLCGKPDRPGENFSLLHESLKTCTEDPKRLTGREVGRIRMVLAHIVTQRGLPGSDRCQHLRRYQMSLAQRPANAELAGIVMDRLADLPQDEGLNTIDAVLAPITAHEAEKHNMTAGQPLAGRLSHKLRRSLTASIESLIEQNLVPSGEVLAKVIPQITAQVSASGLPDPGVQRLYRGIYQAFRRRRSLLLVNLESQVKLTELPWVQAINVHREKNAGTQDQSRQTLERVATLMLTSFPQQILPNKLLKEFQSLTGDAGLQVPLVDELAADIFMGAFAEKFLRAAQMAGRLLQGTLYERYYGLPYERVLQIKGVQPSAYGNTPTSPAFFELCSELAGPIGSRSGVAGNGKIIEQEQILTTHNLAALFLSLELTEAVRPRLPEMARACFTWICRRQQQPTTVWKARLQMVKNTAYAWRQMIFFLALTDEETVRSFMTWAEAHHEEQRLDFRKRFHPAFAGLELSVQGISLDTVPPEEARRFLGWSTGTHWLLAKNEADA